MPSRPHQTACPHTPIKSTWANHCSHARSAALASDGLDDDVAAGVHHERSLQALLDTGHVVVPAEGDDAEGVHQALALLKGVREVRVPEDAAGVVHILAVLTGPLPVDTELMLLLMLILRTFFSVRLTCLGFFC